MVELSSSHSLYMRSPPELSKTIDVNDEQDSFRLRFSFVNAEQNETPDKTTTT